MLKLVNEDKLKYKQTGFLFFVFKIVLAKNLSSGFLVFLSLLQPILV